VLVETEDVVLGKLFLGHRRRPVRKGYDHPVPGDDGAGLVVVGPGLLHSLEQGDLPEDVFLALAAPGQRQVPVGGISHAGRAAPGGPVARSTHTGDQAKNAGPGRKGPDQGEEADSAHGTFFTPSAGPCSRPGSPWSRWRPPE